MARIVAEVVADHGFGHAHAVDIGRIDEIDAEILRRGEGFVAFLFRGGAVSPGKIPTAKPYRRNAGAGFSQLTLFHPAFLDAIERPGNPI